MMHTHLFSDTTGNPRRNPYGFVRARYALFAPSSGRAAIFSGVLPSNLQIGEADGDAPV
jgi:hypothetical protein